jgi:hypothetical protein
LLRKLPVLVTSVVVALAVSLLGAAGVGAAPPVQAKKVSLKNACTLLATANVKQVFGGDRVRAQRAGPLPTHVCYYLSASGREQVGTLTATIEYRKGDDTAPNAVQAVEGVVDPDVAGGVNVEAVDGVGKLAYLYVDDGAIVAAANKALGFRLIWAPGGQPAPMDAKTRKALIRLAKEVVKRAA